MLRGHRVNASFVASSAYSTAAALSAASLVSGRAAAFSDLEPSNPTRLRA